MKVTKSKVNSKKKNKKKHLEDKPGIVEKVKVELSNLENSDVSDSNGDGKLLNSQYKQEIKQTSHKKLNSGGDNLESVSNHKTKRKSEHNISDSEESIDNDIHNFVKKQLNFGTEDMSDFSITSPKKRRKTEDTKRKSQIHKKLEDRSGDTGDSNSSGEEEEMSESILSPKSVTTKGRQNKSPEKQASIVTDVSSRGNNEKTRRQNAKLRYKVPEEFEALDLPTSKSDVYGEDLQNQELWLIKAPINFDIQKLDGVELDLKGSMDLNIGQDDLYEVTGTRDKTGETSQFSAVFSSKEKSSFALGPYFKGQLHVMQSLEIPELPPIKIPEPVIHTIPRDLFPRFEPFGSGKPVILRDIVDDDSKSLSGMKTKLKKEKKKKKHHGKD